MHKLLHYFGAGPAALPAEVKQQIRSDVIQYQQLPISILELSHRSQQFRSILDRATSLLRKLHEIPETYHILFMPGGATMQFDAVPQNLLGKNSIATYINTGFWSRKAAELAKKHAPVQLINGLISNEDRDCCLPFHEWNIHPDSAYVHITPNETIDGIALSEIDPLPVPVIADMTSCLLMRPVDVNRYGLIYAGTQKTLGIAGLTIVIVRDDLLTSARTETPTLLQFDLYAQKQSIVNTSPVFACYVTLLMLEWVDRHGGLQLMCAQARERATALYAAVDSCSHAYNSICDENRSPINVVFDFTKEERRKQFFTRAEEIGLLGLQGHRLVGGVRASMYNGTSMAAVEKLCELLGD